MASLTAKSHGNRRVKLAVLVNTIAPYRLPIYELLAQAFQTVVLHGGSEANRSWKLEPCSSLRTRKVWTVQIPMRKRTGAPGIFDTQYVHFNGGLLWWLPLLRPNLIIPNELGFRTLLAVAYSRWMKVPVWVWWGGAGAPGEETTFESEAHTFA